MFAVVPEQLIDDEAIRKLPYLPNATCTAVRDGFLDGRLLCTFSSVDVPVTLSANITAQLLCKVHLKMVAKHQVCPCGLFPKAFKQKGWRRCDQHHRWHLACFSFCPHCSRVTESDELVSAQ